MKIVKDVKIMDTAMQRITAANAPDKVVLKGRIHQCTYNGNAINAFACGELSNTNEMFLGGGIVGNTQGKDTIYDASYVMSLLSGNGANDTTIVAKRFAEALMHTTNGMRGVETSYLLKKIAEECEELMRMDLISEEEIFGL